MAGYTYTHTLEQNRNSTQLCPDWYLPLSVDVFLFALIHGSDCQAGNSEKTQHLFPTDSSRHISEVSSQYDPSGAFFIFFGRYLVRPDLFEGQEVRVEVETKGTLTRGMSVADWKGQWGKASNCLVLREFLG